MKIVKRNLGHTESFIPREMIVTIESQDEYDALGDALDNLSFRDIQNGGVTPTSSLIIEDLLDTLALRMRRD
tara:strand:+ start:2668 stop:2883 length:216 start_codon:yes stop_codon:yes gene_type:complete